MTPMERMRDAEFIRKGDKKVIRGWVMYDWANSVYQLTITTAIFPIYYGIVTTSQGTDLVNFFGLRVINTVLYELTIAAAFFIMAVLSPMLSSFADYTGRRKTFMKIFTWIGALGCGMLFFFDKNTVELGILAFGLANIGYTGSIVFYNSFLPVIAEPADQDRISARGFSMGYLGGIILLLFNIVMVMKPGWVGIAGDPTMGARISFVTVFLWWIGFSQITFLRLPKYTFRKRERRANVLTNGYKELRSVFNIVRRSQALTFFLFAFFFMMMGNTTVMYLATSFGEKELGLGQEVLIPTLLGNQFVGIVGAWSFARISGRIGNIRALTIAVLGWIFICIGAYTIKGAQGYIIAAMFIGIVMGAVQSLARSTYSKMLPPTTDHTSFFSFYDVMEKMATVLGLSCFAFVEYITLSMRTAVLAVMVFFIISLVFYIVLERKILISQGKEPSLHLQKP